MRLTGSFIVVWGAMGLKLRSRSDLSWTYQLGVQPPAFQSVCSCVDGRYSSLTARRICSIHSEATFHLLKQQVVINCWSYSWIDTGPPSRFMPKNRFVFFLGFLFRLGYVRWMRGCKIPIQFSRKPLSMTISQRCLSALLVFVVWAKPHLPNLILS